MVLFLEIIFVLLVVFSSLTIICVCCFLTTHVAKYRTIQLCVKDCDVTGSLELRKMALKNISSHHNYTDRILRVMGSIIILGLTYDITLIMYQELKYDHDTFYVYEIPHSLYPLSILWLIILLMQSCISMNIIRAYRHGLLPKVDKKRFIKAIMKRKQDKIWLGKCEQEIVILRKRAEDRCMNSFY
jgi:hypothetical protein